MHQMQADEPGRSWLQFCEVFHECLSGAPNVMIEHGHESGRVPAFDRLEDGVVLAPLLGETRLVRPPPQVDAGNRQMRIQIAIELGQPPIARGFDEECVQLDVLPFVLEALAVGRDGPIERFDDRGESGEQIRGEARAERLGCEAFEGATNLEDFGDRLRREAGDECAAARPDLDEALGGQAIHGVLDRCRADAELVCQGADVEALTRAEDAGENPLAEHVEHRV